MPVQNMKEKEQGYKKNDKALNTNEKMHLFT